MHKDIPRAPIFLWKLFNVDGSLGNGNWKAPDTDAINDSRGKAQGQRLQEKAA